MEKYERAWKCLLKLMDILRYAEIMQYDPRIILEYDSCGGYTLIFEKQYWKEGKIVNTEGCHTHGSYCPEVMDEEGKEGVIESFINHILGDKPGLNGVWDGFWKEKSTCNTQCST